MEPKEVLTFESGSTTKRDKYTFDLLFVGVGVIQYGIGDLMFEYPDVQLYREQAEICRRLNTSEIFDDGEILSFRFQRYEEDEDGIRWCSDPAVDIWNLRSARKYVKLADKLERKWKRLQDKSEENIPRPMGSPPGMKAILSELRSV